MIELTERQTECLKFILNSEICPSVREIGGHMGISSTNAVNDHLNALERKGYILRPYGTRSRSIRITIKARAEFMGEEHKRLPELDPMTLRAKEIGRQAIRAWGAENQLGIASEEASELAVAISHLRRERRGSIEEVIEEAADMFICSVQVGLICGDQDFEDKVHQKLDRLRARVADAERKNKKVDTETQED